MKSSKLLPSGLSAKPEDELRAEMSVLQNDN